MTHFIKEIKDEKEGAKHYRHLAHKEPEHGKTFRSMAKDEKGHAKKLSKMEIKEAREKALENKKK